MIEETPLIPVDDMNPSLVSQCMDFIKHLASKGAAFKFSLSLPTGFKFSMDFSQEILTPSRGPEKKKQSPSTLKRNSLRKKQFLEKKAMEKPAGTQPAGSPAQSTEIEFKCDQCEAVYDSKDNLEKHIDETHTEQLTCKECDNTSTSVKCMTEHEKLEHSIEQLDGSTEMIQKTQPIKCEQCDFKAETMQRLKTHVNLKHQGFKCDYCEFTNLSKDTLEKTCAEEAQD